MNCPRCSKKTDVLETRKSKYNEFTKRRRECPTCGHRFTTKELFQEDVPSIKKLREELREARRKIRGLEEFKKQVFGAAYSVSQ
jgi:transcriptional repressor NrdR